MIGDFYFVVYSGNGGFVLLCACLQFLTSEFRKSYGLLTAYLSLMLLCMEKSQFVEACLVLSTQVIYKTLSPQWNQTFEFLETGEPLILHVKDHNAVLPTASIGHCTVEYSMLSPNQSAEKWIPLQGVKSGEIHVRVALKVSVPGSEKKNMLGAGPFGKGHKMSTQVRNT